MLRHLRGAWQAGTRHTSRSSHIGADGSGTGAGASNSASCSGRGLGSRGLAASRMSGGSRGAIRACSSAASAAQVLGRAFPGNVLLGTALLGGGAAVAWNNQQQDGLQPRASLELSQLDWVRQLAAQPGVQEVQMPGRMLRTHPLGQLVSEDDHLFEQMQRSEQVREFRCFYNPAARTFHAVVKLGRAVCGYPATCHGGLTAAIIDESLGGLYTSLLTGGKLGATLPGLTAKLEVEYKRPIAAGSTLLVTTEVESIEQRKVWMRAVVTDGAGTTYASGRALFVAPNLGRLIRRKLGFAPAAVSAAQAVTAAR